jgi:hypothetical protein
MSKNLNRWIYVAAVFAVLSIIFASISFYFYIQAQYYNAQYQKLAYLLNQKKYKISVSMGIQFPNNTLLWFNDTSVNVNTTLWQYMQQKLDGKIAYQNYTSFGACGIFVTGIMGLSNNKTWYWLVFYYLKGAKSWSVLPVGVSCYILQDGDIILWKYTNQTYFS